MIITNHMQNAILYTVIQFSEPVASSLDPGHSNIARVQVVPTSVPAGTSHGLDADPLADIDFFDHFCNQSVEDFLSTYNALFQN